MITLYVGKSGAGKDTFLRKRVALGEKSIVSFTTRPKRENEVDGVDYVFVSESEFKLLIKRNRLTEYRSYNTNVNGKEAVWYYGTPKLEIEKDYVGVVDLDGAKSFIDIYGKDNIEIIYIHVDDNIRKERAKLRGSFDETEWNRRVTDDNVKFSNENLTKLATYLGKSITKIVNNGDLNHVTFSTIEPSI